MGNDAFSFALFYLEGGKKSCLLNNETSSKPFLSFCIPYESIAA